MIATDAAPDIAVVIATRERETRLSFALEALAAQTIDSERFEVVVVRPARHRGPRATPPDGLRVRYVDHRGEPGPAAQRNTGWRATAAELIAFTDDDCRPDRRWLERLVAAGGGPDVFVQGRTEPDPDEAHLLLGLSRTVQVNRPSEWFETCNIAYPASLLRKVGGFDEAFAFSAEDADLGLRAREAGARRVYEDRALVLHGVIPNSLPRALRAALARDSTPLLIARYPQQRRQLHWRYFHKKTHATLPLALAGLAVARRRPALGAALTLPYLRHYVDWRQAITPRGAARIVVFVGARALVDGAEVAVTVREAIRNRVLVV